MLFTDLTHPSTIAALLVEAALFGLAFAAAFLGVLIRPVRWLARGLAAVTVVLGLGGAAEMAWEMWTFRFPVALPDAPLGTYAQPTMLGLLEGLASFGLIAVGAALAFRRPGLGGLLLVLSGLLSLLDTTRMRLLDPTFPPGGFTTSLVAVVLPVLAAGALLLATRRAEGCSPTGRWGKLVHRGPRRHLHPRQGASA